MASFFFRRKKKKKKAKKNGPRCRTGGGAMSTMTEPMIQGDLTAPLFQHQTLSDSTEQTGVGHSKETAQGLHALHNIIRNHHLIHAHSGVGMLYMRTTVLTRSILAVCWPRWYILYK